MILEKKPKQKKRLLIVLIFVIIVLVLSMLTSVVCNKFTSNTWENLGNTEKSVLSELDTLYKETKTSLLWEGYDLNKKPLMLLPKGNIIDSFFGYGYAVNCEGLENKIYARKIELPLASSIKSLYRISFFLPATFGARVWGGNFNTIGSDLHIARSKQVYYLKYSNKENLKPRNSSEHFATFFIHEAFHYYMQNDWNPDNPATEDLNERQIALLKTEYKIFNEMQNELKNPTPNKQNLQDTVREYLTIMQERLSLDKDFVEAELLKETAEGTSSFVGIKAARMVNYDLDIMYFDNRKSVPFEEVFPTIENGDLDISYLTNRGPYESGALLCFVIEQLEIKDWQENLNKQTIDTPCTLYSILNDYIQTL
ncbi:MAG: hypothetical protein RR602_07620 [Longicatena sp.]